MDLKDFTNFAQYSNIWLIKHAGMIVDENAHLIQLLFEDSANLTDFLLNHFPTQDYASTEQSAALVEQWIIERDLAHDFLPAIYSITWSLRYGLHSEYGLELEYRPLTAVIEDCLVWEREAVSLLQLCSVPQAFRVTIGLWDTLLVALTYPPYFKCFWQEAAAIEQDFPL